jgi:transposase
VHRKVHAEFGGRLPRKRPVAGTSPGSPPYDSFDGISHQLCTQHLLRDLEDAAQSYPDAIWPGQIAGELRALIHAANLARGQGLAVVPEDAIAGHLRLFRHGTNAGLSAVRRVPGSHSKQPPAQAMTSLPSQVC